MFVDGWGLLAAVGGFGFLAGGGSGHGFVVFGWTGLWCLGGGT